MDSSSAPVYAVNRGEFVVPQAFNVIAADGFAAFGDAVRAVVADETSSKGQRTAAENQAVSQHAKQYVIHKFASPADNPESLRNLTRACLLQHRIPADVPGFLPIVDVYVPAANPRDYYVAAPSMECTLAEAIYAKTPMELSQILFVATRIAMALRELHANGVVLGALRPELVSINTRLESLTDVAINTLSDAMGADEPLPLMHTAGSQQQRSIPLAYVAPEWALDGVRQLTPAGDMWSLGCLLAEMVVRRPLFAADEPREYAERVTDVLGTKGVNFSSFLTNPSTVRLLKSMPTKQPLSLSVVLQGCSRPLLLLLQQLLVFDPKDRLSAEALLKTPLLAQFQPTLPATSTIAGDWKIPRGAAVDDMIEQLESVARMV